MKEPGSVSISFLFWTRYAHARVRCLCIGHHVRESGRTGEPIVGLLQRIRSGRRKRSVDTRSIEIRVAVVPFTAIPSIVQFQEILSINRYQLNQTDNRDAGLD
jgi:hypothetical protein